MRGSYINQLKSFCIYALFYFIFTSNCFGDGNNFNSLPNLPGPYQVGHTQKIYIDSSRISIFKHLRASAGRPVAVDIWYPTQCSYPVFPLNYTTYTLNHPVDLTPTYVNQYNNVVISGTGYKFGKLTNPTGMYNTTMFLPSPLNAIENANISPGQFPLIVTLPALGEPGNELYQVAELLASHGFIVASVWNSVAGSAPLALAALEQPSLFIDGINTWDGGITRNGIDDLNQTFQLNDPETQFYFQSTVDNEVNDGRFILNTLLALNSNPNQPSPTFYNHIDANKIGTYGDSDGACASMEMSSGAKSRGLSSDPRIKAVFSQAMCGIQDGNPVIPIQDLNTVQAAYFWLDHPDPDFWGPEGSVGYVFNNIHSKIKYRGQVQNTIHGSFTALYWCNMDTAEITQFNPNTSSWWNFAYTQNDYSSNGSYNPQIGPNQNNLPAWNQYVCGNMAYPPNYKNLMLKLTGPESIVGTQWSGSPNTVGFSSGYTYNFEVWPGNWPIFIDLNTLEQIKSTYVVAFFQSNLVGNSFYNLFLTPQYTHNFQPNVINFEACNQNGCQGDLSFPSN